MPAFVAISDNEKKWLKKLLEEKFQLEISDSYSCKQLSECIAEQFDLKINYNTLRRFFNIVATPSQPSSFSVNVLAKSIGFIDFQDFRKYVYKFDKDILNEIIIQGFEQKQIDHRLVMELIADLKSPNWQEIYQLKNIVDLCVQIGDFVLLKKIVHLPFDPYAEEFQEKYTLCFQSIYFEAKGKNELVNSFVLQNIGSSEILQRILLQVYISEDQLSGFWGNWLEAASVDLVSDMLVFKNVLLCQKKFQENQMEEAQKHLILAKNAIKKSPQSVHPILLGRAAAWEIILHKPHSQSPLYFQEINSSFGKACYFVFYFRLLSLYNKQRIQDGVLEQINLEQFPLKLGAFDKKILSKFNLTTALYFHAISNKPMAKTCFMKIDERRLDVWENNWFYENFVDLSEIYS